MTSTLQTHLAAPPDHDSGVVDPGQLHCPSCREQVRCAPPQGWPDRAGAAPLFSHPDGTVLCLDQAGRINEPVEIRA
ncbi:hypothetical protein EV383_6257 [Pseudonocardia sediminis]|uniref:Uncharacterized protein n=1 Tax=Pseudonocardia sediminis TaxID=1397368 RepID=A0A4Q7U8K3_PSEST|nr:hypothetical protein [Pseudonocardia sediminis]RZT75516.1 hypothetical protein EV383_6257 [Pseudonocardia sediminis]